MAPCLVVGPTDLGGTDKKLKGVTFVDLHSSRLHLSLEHLHALFAMSRKSEFFFVAPENTWPAFWLGCRTIFRKKFEIVLEIITLKPISFDIGLGQDVMNMNNLISPLLTNQTNNRPLIGFDPIFNEEPQPIIELYTFRLAHSENIFS